MTTQRRALAPVTSDEPSSVHSAAFRASMAAALASSGLGGHRLAAATRAAVAVARGCSEASREVQMPMSRPTPVRHLAPPARTTTTVCAPPEEPGPERSGAAAQDQHPAATRHRERGAGLEEHLLLGAGAGRETPEAAPVCACGAVGPPCWSRREVQTWYRGHVEAALDSFTTRLETETS